MKAASWARVPCAVLLIMSVLSAAAQRIGPSNDAQQGEAYYENKLFKLREPGAKDSYSISVKVGTQTTALVLPKGASGLVVGPSTVPAAGTWSWSWVLQRDKIDNTLATNIQGTVQVSYPYLVQYENAIPLEWTHIGASSYKVIVRTDSKTDFTKPPDWGKPAEIALNDEAINTKRNIGHYDVPLKLGTRIELQVAALDPDGITIARSTPTIVFTNPLWSDRPSKAGLKFQRAETLTSKEQAAKPAFFGMNSTQTEGTARQRAYQAEFAAIWSAASPLGRTELYPRASLEARLHSSGTAKSGDAYKLRLGALRTFESLDLSGSFKYETESKTHTKKALVEVGATPFVAPFYLWYPRPTAETTNVGGNYPYGKLPHLQIMPQLTLGADIGRTLDIGTSTETGRSVFRQWADLRLDTRINTLADALRIPAVTLGVGSKRWHINNVGKSNFSLSSVNLSLQVTKELSVDLIYSVGEDAPDFKFNRNASIGLGLKF